MRLIDADWLSESIDAWRATLEATYGKNDEYVLCLGEVLGKIENAPTIEPTQTNDANVLNALTPRWIPVTERMPEEFETVLITVKSRDSKAEPWLYFTDVATYDGLDWETFNDWDEGQEYYITAWMPLPECYRGRVECLM